MAFNLTKPRFNVIELAIIAVGIASPLLAVAISNRARLANFAEAALVTPLPELTLAAEGPFVPTHSVYRKAYVFSSDWFTNRIPVWEAALGSYKGVAGVQYLEVGVFEGRSALWMLENVLTHPTSRLVGIDVFSGSLKERYLDNLQRSEASDRVVTINEPSQVALRRLALESFDIIYIDGSHAEDDVLEDAVLSFRLLKPGGVMIFDDYRWARAVSTTPGDQTDFAKPSIDRFAAAFHDHLETIHNGYQLVVRKR